jgi:Lar family restriction alleviation protein
MAELKPCPFCGSTKLKIDRKSRLAGWNGLDMRVEMHTYSARCNTCHARGGSVGGRVMNDPVNTRLPNWATTDKTLEAKAIEAWNRRADNGDKESV